MDSPHTSKSKIEFELLNRYHPRVQSLSDTRAKELEELSSVKEKSLRSKGALRAAVFNELRMELLTLKGNSGILKSNSYGYPEVREFVLAVLAEMVAEGWKIEGFNATASRGVHDIHVLLRRERA